MEQRFNADVDASQSEVFRLLADLSTYPDWLDIVTRVEDAPSVSGDASPAWLVTLRAQLGPLARSKKLRMVRTVHDEPSEVRFDRVETDRRQHSSWSLVATTESLDMPDRRQQVRVTMQLGYDGKLWTSLLGGVLESRAAEAATKLGRLAVSGRGI